MLMSVKSHLETFGGAFLMISRNEDGNWLLTVSSSPGSRFLFTNHTWYLAFRTGEGERNYWSLFVCLKTGFFSAIRSVFWLRSSSDDNMGFQPLPAPSKEGYFSKIEEIFLTALEQTVECPRLWRIMMIY